MMVVTVRGGGDGIGFDGLYLYDRGGDGGVAGDKGRWREWWWQHIICSGSVERLISVSDYFHLFFFFSFFLPSLVSFLQ